MQSAHNNKHNNDNTNSLTGISNGNRYESNVNNRDRCLAGTAIAGKCKVIDNPVEDINYGILKSSP